MRTFKKRLERLEIHSGLKRRIDQAILASSEVFPPTWSPKSVAQRLALESRADILLFGGAAGSLKTETLLVDAALESANGNLRAIIFRQQLTQQRDIVEKSHRLYQPMCAVYSSSTLTWTFPSGATIQFAYISTDQDIWQYWGHRYSFIGFDESTFHTEYQIRNMLGRLSSTDRTLRLRMRLASNPGSTGAAFHKRMFLRGGCPVHSPRQCAESGRLYWNACWPSDQVPLGHGEGNGFSVAFIPGRLTDHDLLDPQYIYRLRMMSGSLSAAMEQGCWCALQGAYFANFDTKKMVIPYPSIEQLWWDHYFISIDYGFGKSSAAAHLHVRTQDGKIITIGEIVERNLPAYEFAEEVVRRFVVPTVQGQRRRIIAVYLDPVNFNRTGVGHTIADQINEVLADHDLAAIPAANDRSGGWQLMYQKLQTGEYQIADTCPKLIEAIPSRMHDEKRPGDLRKVPGDDLDDVADSARYALYTFINAAEEPCERVDYEYLKVLAENHDLTSALINWHLMTEDRQPNYRPARLGRRRR